MIQEHDVPTVKLRTYHIRAGEMAVPPNLNSTHFRGRSLLLLILLTHICDVLFLKQFLKGGFLPVDVRQKSNLCIP